jgi:hypothetical protein
MTVGALGCGGGGGSNAKDADAGGSGGMDGGVEVPSSNDASDGSTEAGVDAAPPPTMLTAVVMDRRQSSFLLTWPAPSNNGQAVSGYQVRYAKVPITTANFDDTTVTTMVPYGKTPAAPGTGDSLLVEHLYIENNYYFAVTGVDSGGAHVGPFMMTTGPVAAHFNISQINSPSGGNQIFGSSIDGSGDLNGDGISDLLVGTSNNDTHAYLFFGGANFAPTTPNVTFTGANMAFGATVRQIGDIDKDGLQDLAISDQNGNRVLIYKGRASWPSTLMDTDANYVINADATWAASVFGISMARLGDFDGDGTDDFAIGGPAFNTRVGRVVVVYGRSGFATITMPDTTHTLEIGGDATLVRTQFGTSIVGLGHFYTATIGTTMVVSATGVGDATNASDNQGRIYAFHGRGPGAPIDVTAADNVRVGTTKGARSGQNLTNLGAVVNTLPSVGSGNQFDAASMTGITGNAFILSGSVAAGPFATTLTVLQNGGSGIGQVLFGGAVSGRNTVLSVIGDTKPDFAITSTTAATSIDIVDGAKVPALTGTVDSSTIADVHVPLPSGWMGTLTGGNNLIPDINGDSVPDFALGDAFGTVPGRVAVFW